MDFSIFRYTGYNTTIMTTGLWWHGGVRKGRFQQSDTTHSGTGEKETLNINVVGKKTRRGFLETALAQSVFECHHCQELDSFGVKEPFLHTRMRARFLAEGSLGLLFTVGGAPRKFPSRGRHKLKLTRRHSHSAR